ncbi:MAG: multicopper oxidase domain-containing protein [Candidatus Manganitrophus sp.]|nr:multicopper oxidase domain-containing protein [Candidatus Manganitrophus sp.]
MKRSARKRPKTKRPARAKIPFPAAAVSAGLQGDLIQPLVIRANAGDCVRITLRNQTENDEPVSLHIHGSSMVVKATGQAATMANKDSHGRPRQDTGV